MQLHTLKRNTPNKTKKRVGRGGKRGKTSGRGTKGQKARAGHRLYPEIRDMIKKIPKRRGHGKNRSRTVNDGRVNPVIINLAVIDRHYTSGETVSPATLVEKKIVSKKGNRIPVVKILGTGTLSKKINISGCSMSVSVRQHIEKNGGSADA